MDFAELQAYVTVCEEGKMSQAAEKLFMSKQTLSMIIKRIESEAGAQLLIRTGSGIEPTPEGECFLSYARRLLRTWNTCREELENMRTTKKKKLSVGFGYMSWNFWTKERQERFLRENPDIELNAFGELSKELLGRLDAGRLDIAVTCMQTNRHAQYRVMEICDMSVGVMMTQGDPLAQRETVDVEALQGRKIAYPDSGAGFIRDFCGFLEGLQIRTEPVLMPAGNFFRELLFAREEGALLLTNQMHQMMLPKIDGFITRPLVYRGEEPMPKILLCALMPREQSGGDAAVRFTQFLRREILPPERTM